VTAPALTVRALSSIAIGVLVLTGCSGNDPATAPPATPTGAITPAMTPTSAKTPATLTREQAGKRYLQIVKPYNDLQEDEKCKAVDDYYIDGGSWPPDDHPDWDDKAHRVVRDCYKRYVTISVQQTKDLQTTHWPAESADDMADLISLNQALLHCFRQGSRATSDDDANEIYNCFPKDDDSADRVRARFGLPGRTP
jgi:hypothetical protein